jgi:hypothetical protein
VIARSSLPGMEEIMVRMNRMKEGKKHTDDIMRKMIHVLYLAKPTSVSQSAALPERLPKGAYQIIFVITKRIYIMRG